MSIHRKADEGDSGLSVLTELAVEGTSSLAETHRTLLDLAQQENNVVLKGLKDRVSGFAPAAAMTDLVRRSLDSLIEMQQELLTAMSKQTARWLGPEKTSSAERTAEILEFAREGVESFAKAQKKFLDAVSEESEKAMRGTGASTMGTATPANLNQLARDAGSAFIEAQKRLLDIANQQMNVNLDAAKRTAGILSPEQLMPIAALASDSVKSFFEAQSDLVGSLAARSETSARRKSKKAHHRSRTRPGVAA